MIEDTDAPFIVKPKRNPERWGKKSKGDGFSNKAKKQWKNRERELHEDDLDDEIKDYQ